MPPQRLSNCQVDYGRDRECSVRLDSNQGPCTLASDAAACISDPAVEAHSSRSKRVERSQRHRADKNKGVKTNNEAALCNSGRDDRPGLRADARDDADRFVEEAAASCKRSRTHGLRLREAPRRDAADDRIGEEQAGRCRPHHPVRGRHLVRRILTRETSRSALLRHRVQGDAITPPAELAVPDDKFSEFFGESWSGVLSQGRAFTAIDACKELGLSGSEMDEGLGAAKGAGKIIKLGGGFYAGQLAKGDSSIYTFNAFYMSMRDRFTQPGGSIHYFAVEWDASTLPWADFRGKLLGPTDRSRRRLIVLGSDLQRLEEPGFVRRAEHGRQRRPRVGVALRGPHGEDELAPGQAVEDAFGAAIIADGLDEATLAKWILDPWVRTRTGRARSSTGLGGFCGRGRLCCQTGKGR